MTVLRSDCTEMGTFKIGLTVVISRGIFYRVAHLFLNSISYEFDRPRDRLLPSTGRTPPKTDKIIGKIRFIICSRTSAGFFRASRTSSGCLLASRNLYFKILCSVLCSIVNSFRSFLFSQAGGVLGLSPQAKSDARHSVSIRIFHKIYFYISEFYFFTMEQVDTLNGGGR